MSAAALTVALLFAAGPAHPNHWLERGIAQVQHLQEKEAVRTLELARSSPDNTPEQLAQCYLWMGLAYAGLNQPTKAKESFHAALLLEPTLALPPRQSPRITQWFAEAGGKAAEPAPTPDAPTQTEPAPRTEVVASTPAQPAPVPVVASPTVVDKPAPAHRGSPGLRTAGIVLGAAGLVAIGAGVFFGTRSAGFTQDAQTNRQLDAAAASHSDAVHAAQTANGCYLGGGIAALAGAGMIAFSF